MSFLKASRLYNSCTNTVPRKKSLMVLAGMSLLSLSACGPDYVHYDDPTETYENPAINNSVDSIIASEAAAAVKSQQMEARIQRTIAPPTITDPNAGAPPEFLQKVTELNWSGPVDALVKSLAEKVGYNYVPLAHDAPTSIDVSINIVNRTVAEALDDISLQIQSQASIVVDGSRRTISLHLNGSRLPDLPAENIGHRAPPRHGHRHTYHPKSSHS